MIDQNFEDALRDFSLPKLPQEGENFTSKITEKYNNLKQQKNELEKYLADSPNSLFANIHPNEMIHILKNEEENKNFLLNESINPIAQKQHLLKAFNKMDIQKIKNIQSKLEVFREKLHKLKLLYEDYKILEIQAKDGNFINILSRISLIKNQMEAFEQDYSQTKLFKHLKKKIEKYYQDQIKIFKINMKNFYTLYEDYIEFNPINIETFLNEIPLEFLDFRQVLFKEIQLLLMDKMEIQIFQDHFQINNLKYEYFAEESLFPIKLIIFETINQNFPNDEKDFHIFSELIERFFEIYFNNIKLFDILKGNEDENNLKDYFLQKLLEFLKIVNIKIFAKENRIKLAKKIKELESKFNSFAYFKKEFFSYFENIQYAEISEKNKFELLDFKNCFCEILKNIKKSNERNHYIELNEKVANQIECLERKYQFKLDIAKEEENKILFFSFLYFFQLILELIKIFEDEMEEKDSMFYNSLISILNITGNGLNKFCEFFISTNDMKDKIYLNPIFKLNRIITTMETNFLNKLSLETEISIN